MNWRKVLIIATTVFLLDTPSYAAVHQQQDSSRDYQITYPIITENNRQLQDTINTDIHLLVNDFLNAYKSGDFLHGSFKYDVKYDDNNYLSIVFYDYRFFGGSHGPEITTIVWNKQTGEQLPLSYFVRIKSLNDLIDSIGYWKAYNYSGKKISISMVKENLIIANKNPLVKEKIPQEYFLAKNGCVAVMGYFGSTADGPCSIILDQELVDFYNRRNK